MGVPINDYVANIIQAQLLFLESTDSSKDIELYINSPGGQVYAGLGIYDTAVHKSKSFDYLYWNGCIYGCYFALCWRKRKRYALKHSRVMIHQPLGGAHGQASDIEITANEIKKLKNELYEIIANHSNKSFDQVYKDGDRDYWMTSSEAKEYGMLDEVLKILMNNSTELTKCSFFAQKAKKK